MPTPYIGITGFMSQNEIERVLNVLPEGSDRLVMVGVLADNETIRGESSDFPKHYPHASSLGSIFLGSSPHCKLLNLVYFNTNDPDHLLDDLCLVHEMAGMCCNGMRLNVAWPDKKALEKALEQYKKLFPDKTVVLQCFPKAIDEAGAPKQLAMRVKEYEGLVDYVVIDQGGMLLDPIFAAAHLYALTADVQTSIGVVLEGGLSAQTLSRQIVSLASNYRFSIDAQWNLRNEKDLLDVDEARLYLLTADNIFRKYMEV